MREKGREGEESMKVRKDESVDVSSSNYRQPPVSDSVGESALINWPPSKMQVNPLTAVTF